MSNENNMDQNPYYTESDNSVEVRTPFANKDDVTDDAFNDTSFNDDNVYDQGIVELEIETQYYNANLSDEAAQNNNISSSNLDGELNDNGLNDNELNDSVEDPESQTAIPVDITILNEDYTIYCPKGEEQELHAATTDINEFINSIRKEAPMLSQKNLLVLACLNLYEKMRQAQNASSLNTETLQHATLMVDQMIDNVPLEDSE